MPKTKTKPESTTKKKAKNIKPAAKSAPTKTARKPRMEKPTEAAEVASAAPRVKPADPPRVAPPGTAPVLAQPASPMTAVAQSAQPQAATTDSRAEPRMPPEGTVLVKKDRAGGVRCQATVVRDGVAYAGKVYKSLSAAALAASADLGLATTACNGRLFWGLSKPARASASDPLRGLERAFEKYAGVAEAFLGKAKCGEHKEPILTALDRHVRVLKNLHDEVA